MLIILTHRAIEFASLHEGEEALRAKAEVEIEQLEFLYRNVSVQWVAASFSWHGENNMTLFRSPRKRDRVVVDLHVEDDEAAFLERSREIVDIAHQPEIPLTKENSDG